MSSLEEFLRRRLAEWGYDDPSEAEYTAGIIEEESLEDADKLEAILGILNTDLENEDMKMKVEQLLEESAALLLELAVQHQLSLEAQATILPPNPTKSNTPLTPEEEALRRKQLLQSFGYLEEDEPLPVKKGGKAAVETDVTVVMPDGKTMSKKARKKAEEGIDLLAQPNINKALVKGAELQRRNEDAAKSSAKKARDQQDLLKQKADAIKSANDKKKKAVKQERRA